LEPLIKRRIETAEPVQLTVDFLEYMLTLRQDEETTQLFWESLLKEKRREITEDYYALSPLCSTMHSGLAYSEGMNSGRLLVMRILIGILPSYRSTSLSLLSDCHNNIEETIREVVSYLKSLYMSNEGDSELWKSAVLHSIKLLKHRGFSPYALRRGGWPALVTVPPYREQTAACYLFHPHAVILFSDSALSHAKRIYLFLHEIGHIIFRKYVTKHVLEILLRLISQLKTHENEKLFCPGSQGDEEIFANLFAMAMLADTPQGKQLFSEYYNKGRTISLIRKIINPSMILRHR
jgi:hypothetical protein